MSTAQPISQIFCDPELLYLASFWIDHFLTVYEPATWRRLLIQVAVPVVRQSRRVVLRLWQGWPFLEQFQYVLQRLTTAGSPQSLPP